jgi:DNA-binding FrmR family transcriptional regulator
LYCAVIDAQDVTEPSLVADIEFIADCFYVAYPDYFFPYYFHRYYYRLVAIFYEFGIYLPPVPPKNDFGKRMLHYMELCKSLYKFRIINNLSGFEIAAFIYGFALNIIKKPGICRISPEPRKAFFVGGGINNNGDFDYLDKADKNSVTFWNGNPDTETGDIIVMYCLSPRSYIHSIWRAVAPGTRDPFFYYYKVIYIGMPKQVKPITISELKKDRILSEMPLVKGNMQGINGRLIQKKYCDRILQLLEAKGQDISDLPQLLVDALPDIEIRNERDVEKHLLEPLLNKLGFKEHHWKKQLSLRMGRGYSVFPDYVIFPVEERNNESGYWVWEAKLTIINNKQLSEDFGQVKSYALRLNCKGLGLISKEGIWLSVPDFSFEKIMCKGTNSLRNKEHDTRIDG